MPRIDPQNGCSQSRRLNIRIDDLLDEWQSAYRPPFEGVRVIDYRWSADGHQVRDFLARNLVPYQWLDIETNADARRLVQLAEGDAHRLPLVLFSDGSQLVRPAPI